MPGWRPSVLYAAAALGAGCDSRVYDHTPPGMVPDAAETACVDASGGNGCGRAGMDGGRQAVAGGCSETSEGAECDDRDICTPGSVCRSGACFGENPYDTCIVADSVDDFSYVQGDKGWWYGYWNAADDPDGSYDPATDFRLMEFCGRDIWMPPECAIDPEREPRWTRNVAHGLQHAETRPHLQLPVRRWVSDVSGPARIYAEHSINGGQGGDGTRALLLVDGAEIWRHDALPRDDPGKATLDVELEVGTLVEQLLHPIQTQGEDMTYFSIRIAP